MKLSVERKMFELPNKMPFKGSGRAIFQDLLEGEPYMAVCKVIPLFNTNNEQKGFKIISLMKIRDKNKKVEIKEKPLTSIKRESEDL